jgi:cell wall-associated NlpC family hydrolase
MDKFWGNQFVIKIEKDLNSRLATINQTVAPQVAEKIADAMKQNSATGKAFGNDRYDDQYVDSYKKKRQKAGLGTSPVVMRFKSNRIENTRVESTSKGATISFADSKAGEIFKYHHDGIDYKKVGNRMRSIFPKETSSIPQEIKDFAEKLIGDILRGR